jgi:hypothetical protein
MMVSMHGHWAAKPRRRGYCFKRQATWVSQVRCASILGMQNHDIMQRLRTI